MEHATIHGSQHSHMPTPTASHSLNQGMTLTPQHNTPQVAPIRVQLHSLHPKAPTKTQLVQASSKHPPMNETSFHSPRLSPIIPRKREQRSIQNEAPVYRGAVYTGGMPRWKHPRTHGNPYRSAQPLHLHNTETITGTNKECTNCRTPRRYMNEHQSRAINLASKRHRTSNTVQVGHKRWASPYQTRRQGNNKASIIYKTSYCIQKQIVRAQISAQGLIVYRTVVLIAPTKYLPDHHKSIEH